jgi:hypothetical protein
VVHLPPEGYDTHRGAFRSTSSLLAASISGIAPGRLAGMQGQDLVHDGTYPQKIFFGPSRHRSPNHYRKNGRGGPAAGISGTAPESRTGIEPAFPRLLAPAHNHSATCSTSTDASPLTRRGVFRP